MNIKLLDLTRQYGKLKEELEKAVLLTAASGNYIGGAVVDEFEKKFAEYIGVKYAVSVNSGTDALVLAMKAAGIQTGDEVITTPFTFFASAEAIAYIGAVPVFVDIEANTYNIDADKIQEKITDKTKAILPVHIFGCPADMGRINEIAETYGIKVIEDACQAVGASICGTKTGSFGMAGCFSFFPTKNLGGFGDGGMITTDDEEVAVYCRALKEHGSGRNGARAYEISGGSSEKLHTAEIQTDLYNPQKYFNYLVGGNSRLDAIQAAVLNVKLCYLDEFNARRNSIADLYDAAFGSDEHFRISIGQENVYSVRHQYAFRCEDKHEILKYLGQQGIGAASFYPIPLHLQTAFSYLGYQRGQLPISEQVCAETVCLPIYPELTEGEMESIIKTVKEYYKR